MKLCPKCQKQFSNDANFCPVDAARLVPLEAQAAGPDALAARFDLGDQLGGSQTGAVHRATDKTTGKACAVKLIAKGVVALPGVAQRLDRELKQLERVQSSGVAKVLASGRRVSGGDEPWVAMELIEGAQTLAAAIAARGAIPVEQAAELIEVIGEALIEAAQVGVVHRDLAPKNVLFAGQDVKLINFSLPVPTTDKVPGVPEFVAPEQVDGRPVDQRSNLYSLGALYYYVLTGQPVFTGAPDAVHKQHQSGSIRPPSQLAQVPPPVEAVIMRALDRSPTKRFLTVRQFVDEVGKVGRGEVIELKTTNPMPMGKASARAKGPLVQTLMGIKGGGGMAPIASAPTAPGGLAALAPQPAPAAPAPAPQMAAPAMAQGSGTPVAAQGSASRPPVQLGQTVMGVPSGQQAPAAAPAMAGSPWAPPASQPQAPVVAPPVVAAPQVAAPVIAAPVVAAPQVAAPQVAAPQVAAAPAGKKKADEGNKGKFRETMWFKKGELDAQAAQAAAEERARTGKDVSADKADSLPMDERYKDDGSITRSDKEKYSLRTGATMMMQRVEGSPEASMNKVSEDALIGEMKKGRSFVLLGILIAIGVVVAIVVFATR